MDPFININKNIMRVIGHWPYQSINENRIIRFLLFLGCFSLHIPIWIKLYKSRNDFDDLLLCLPMAITTIFYYTTLIFYIFKTPQMLILLDWMARDYKEFESHEAELKILKKSAAEGKFAVKLFAIYTGMSTIGYCIEGLLPPILDLIIPINETRPKIQLAELDYVFFNVEANFYLPFAHTALMGAFVIATIVSSDMMLYTFCQHACGMFRVLRYINTLNSCYKSFLFVSVGIEIMLMSFQGAMIVIKSSDRNIVSLYGTFYLAQLIHLFYTCIPGQKLLDHSRELTNYICFAEWYDMPPKVKKLNLMIITRSIKESKITIGNFFILSKETFASILKTIFSYLSVLTSMKD